MFSGLYRNAEIEKFRRKRALRSPLLASIVLTFFALLSTMDALAAQEKSREPSPGAAPEKAIVGMHINEIQGIDMRSNSYSLDFYIWFRWTNPEINPWESLEFMNSFEPENHVRTPIYEQPQKMPDGSLYMVLRERGKFSSKFPLHRFPFDSQQLEILVEDSVSDIETLIYVPDTTTRAPVTVNAGITLPGFTIGTPRMKLETFYYDTTFGDLNYREGTSYSRARFLIPLNRPQLAMAIKIFLPIVLILTCTAMVYFVHPFYIEGRLGVVITALLTLVALQLTSASSLPEVDYLLLTDKIYILSYLFIILTLWQIVRTSKKVKDENYQSVAKSNMIVLSVFTLLLIVGASLTFMFAL